ncbi:Caspase domain [seawater metagenome]|uniref:Caspase domain n=1 Tax=seawater metagenome TaxID=1561972 RepID=A0A5E8CMH5_9ZZZZ
MENDKFIKLLKKLELSSYNEYFKNKKINTIDKLVKLRITDLMNLGLSQKRILLLLCFLKKYDNKKIKKDKPILTKKLNSIFMKKRLVIDTNPTYIRQLSQSPIMRFNSNSPINLFRGLKKSTCRKITPIIKKLQYRKKILISFGIVDYENWPRLKNALNDANALGKFAKEKLKFDIIYIYHNENVTKSSIEKIITHDLYKISNEDDLVVVSFHGHGYSMDFKSFTEGFLVPVNASKDPTPFELISMNNLSKWFKYIKAKHILLLLDCCFSGLSVLRGRNTPIKQFNSDNTVEIIDNKINNTKGPTQNDFRAIAEYFKDEDLSYRAINKHLNSCSRIIINAGTTYEEVADGGWNGNSVFTGAIISSPTFNNKIGSVMNLYYYLLKTIPRYSNQTPSIGKMEGDMGTDIFLRL